MSTGTKLCTRSLAIGTFAAGISSGLLGIVVAGGNWEGDFSTNAMTGVFMAGASGLFVGWLMSWNAIALKASHQDVPASRLWGLITGVVMGAALGPVVSASIGILVGQFVNGLVYGCLLFGPVAGVVAWQVAFAAPGLIASRS